MSVQKTTSARVEGFQEELNSHYVVSEDEIYYVAWILAVSLPTKVGVVLTMPSRCSVGAHKGK